MIKTSHVPEKTDVCLKLLYSLCLVLIFSDLNSPDELQKQIALINSVTPLALPKDIFMVTFG
ncbi:hypothetical protein MTR_7g073470 [Medicago truncatula]|uniref:Uncharacterized protein n=1 Tax=Medicago truncatula TaxID=3880 RepID=A0A072UBP3_MEDTR|nr:hypothetical protein MTR_7g073470 [Medicago truncatula]